MTDDWLREALNDAVSDVEPREALDSIRSRTKVTHVSGRRPWMFAAGGALLATAATITAIALASGGDNPKSGDEPPVVAPPSQTTGPVEPANPVAVPVYYLGEVTYHAGEGGEMQTAFRLYREWAEADGSGTPEEVAAEAVERMLEPAADPDYTTLWNHDVEVNSVTVDAGVISVDLGGPVQTANVGAESAELSVQQLVYTVQGALAVVDDPAASSPVRILVDGEPAGDLWGHVDASRPVKRAGKTGTQAPIWITEPSDGAAVDMPLTVKGVAQAFEGTVSYRVLLYGEEVASGFVTAAEGAPAFAAYSIELEGLASVPGEYLLEVYEASPLDGADTFLDSKTFVVR